MHAAVLCVALFAWAPAAVAAHPTIAIDRFPSIAGPILRTQPVPRPAPSHSDDRTAVTETDGNATSSLHQQQLQSTQSPDDTNLPQKTTQPAGTNKTAAATDACAPCSYFDEDVEHVEDSYVPFFCCIPIFFLIMLLLLGFLKFQSFCTSWRMKNESVETMCLQMRHSQYDIIQD